MSYLKIEKSGNNYIFRNKEEQFVASMVVEGGKIIKFTGTNHGRMDASDSQDIRFYVQEVHQFIEEKNFEPIKDLSNMGFVRGDDGKLYDLYHLPEGFKIKNLDLSYMKEISLPKNLACENLYAFGSAQINMKSCYITNLYATDADYVSYYSPYWRREYVRHIVYDLDDLKKHPEAFKVYKSYLPTIESKTFLDLQDGFCAYELYTDEAMKKEKISINQALRKAEADKKIRIFALKDPQGQTFITFKLGQWQRVEGEKTDSIVLCHEVLEYNTPNNQPLSSAYSPYVLRFIKKMGLKPASELSRINARYHIGKLAPNQYPRDFLELGIAINHYQGNIVNYFTPNKFPLSVYNVALPPQQNISIPDNFTAISLKLNGSYNVTIGNNVKIEKLELDSAQNVVIGDNAQIEDLNLRHAKNIYIGENAQIKSSLMGNAENIVIAKGLQTKYLDLWNAKHVNLSEFSGRIDLEGATDVILSEKTNLKIPYTKRELDMLGCQCWMAGEGLTIPDKYLYYHLKLDDKSEVLLPPSILDVSVDGIDAKRVKYLRNLYTQAMQKKDDTMTKIEANKEKFRASLKSKQVIPFILQAKERD